MLKPYVFQELREADSEEPEALLSRPGDRHFLLGFHTTEAILQGPSIEPLPETAVVSEWLKALRHRGERPELYYWKSSSGEEVDLVFERNGRLHGIEVKATATPMPKHAATLEKWLALAGQNARGVLACRADEPQSLSRQTRVVPWHLASCGGKRNLLTLTTKLLEPIPGARLPRFPSESDATCNNCRTVARRSRGDTARLVHAARVRSPLLGFVEKREPVFKGR